MKPVNLKIKGFKSFIEECEIDFEQLTVNNLFGIAGATRSGKTSILDAIILSLYGTIKKTSSIFNYVNLKSDAAQLEFTFELLTQGKRRTYCVKRIFKVKNKVHTAELFELTGEGRIAIESNSKNVTKYITELLGLDADDFTQVVIMQQGEFDKFIKAKPATRNEIIGRIFHLDKYGDKLGERIKLRRAVLKEKLSELKGRIDAYGAISAEEIKLKERTYKENKKGFADLSARTAAAQEKAERLKKFYTDYTGRLSRAEQIKKAETEIEESAKNYKRAEQAFEIVNKETVCVRAELKAGFDGLAAGREKLKTAEASYSEKSELEEKRKQLLTEYSAYRKTADESRTESERIKVGNAGLNEKNRKVIAHFSSYTELDGDDAEGSAKSFLARAEEGQTRYVALKAEAETLSKIIKNDTAELAAREKVHAETLANQESDKRRASELTAKIELSERECGETAQAVNVIFKHVRGGESCPVCGGIVGENCAKDIPIARREEYVAAVDTLREVNQRLEDYRAYIPTGALEIDNIGKRLLERREKLNEINAKIIDYRQLPLEELNKEINAFSKDKRLIAENEKKLAELFADFKIAEDGMKNTEERGRENNAKIESLTEKIKAVTPDGFENARKKIETADRELKAREKLAESRLEESRRELESAGKKVAEADAGLKRHKEELAAIKTDTAVTVEELDAAAVLFSGLTEEKEKQNRGLILLEQNINNAKRIYDTYKLDEASRKEYQAKFDLLESLSGLIKGKELLNFMAEEYINSFTLNASKRLHELTLGQYTLQYTDEFEVVDNFNGGKSRGVDTLSGGETFLVSLSLAIAISEEIADTRQFEFFFIDEGFGTLDADLVEMVLGCLERLKHPGFNIGLISHRQELMQKIIVKLQVSPATDEHGSTVSIVY